MIIATLNMERVRKEKFEQLKVIIQENIDILVITESKLNNTFPMGQFAINGYKLYRKDRDQYGGGILIYIREDIPSKLLDGYKFPDDIEGLFLEINLKNTKWGLFGSYHPPSQEDKYYFSRKKLAGLLMFTVTYLINISYSVILTRRRGKVTLKIFFTHTILKIYKKKKHVTKASTTLAVLILF